MYREEAASLNEGRAANTDGDAGLKGSCTPGPGLASTEEDIEEKEV